MLLLNPFTFAPPYDQEQRYGPKAQNPQKDLRGHHTYLVPLTFKLWDITHIKIGTCPKYTVHLDWSGTCCNELVDLIWLADIFGMESIPRPRGSAIALILEHYWLSPYNGHLRILKDLCAAADSYCSFQLAFGPNLSANQSMGSYTLPCTSWIELGKLKFQEKFRSPWPNLLRIKMSG